MWNLFNDRQSKKYFIFSHVCMLSRVWLFCDPMNYSPPSFSVHGIFQARILAWVAISFSRGSFQPRDQTQVSCIADRFFTSWATSKAQDNITKKQKKKKITASSFILTSLPENFPLLAIWCAMSGADALAMVLTSWKCSKNPCNNYSENGIFTILLSRNPERH